MKDATFDSIISHVTHLVQYSEQRIMTLLRDGSQNDSEVATILCCRQSTVTFLRAHLEANAAGSDSVSTEQLFEFMRDKQWELINGVFASLDGSGRLADEGIFMYFMHHGKLVSASGIHEQLYKYRDDI